ncbi:hypothetical protein BV25DRAFT_1062995 [Artomyces pyxidatus]|uniref:Uncharacterized protein n=1 Tax=Artomyces pyxidatus TaxID=48021 RepID=A0ACB8SSR2_9AGAM|nr:hypothetical protein BV25DRAFT_1062995 [Artomyces pyxidatus]
MASPLIYAPEQFPLGNPYNYKVDIWQYGLVILDMFVGSGLAFFRYQDGETFLGEHDILNRDMAAEIDFYADTPAARDLLKKILVRDPQKRLEISEIKAHPFFQDLDGFSWEGCARGEIEPFYRPLRPTGNASLVVNHVSVDSDCAPTANARELPFPNKFFNYLCPPWLIDLDPQFYQPWRVRVKVPSSNVTRRVTQPDGYIPTQIIPLQAPSARDEFYGHVASTDSGVLPALRH